MGKTLLLTTIPLVLCVLFPASGTTWYVDCWVPTSGDGLHWWTAFQTIQEGLNAANNGDTVIVAEGIYQQNVLFRGRNVVLRSKSPSTASVVANTIIDGKGSGSVLTFLGNEDESSILSGFTIRNGSGWDGGGICGGTSENHTRATIRDNVIRDNSASYRGGGIAFCDGVLHNNTVSENTAHVGGGIAHCDGIIENSTVSRNSARQDGGGLSNCTGSIRNNIIHKNSSRYSGGGLHFCGAVIENNKIIANRATDSGGGLFGCDGTIQGNVIAGNGCGVSGQEGYGGGLYECSGAIRNNTIVGNQALGEREVNCGYWCHEWVYGQGGGLYGCAGTIQNCIIWGNSATLSPHQLSNWNPPLQSCIQGWTEVGRGNISDDPRFADPDGADNYPHTYEDNNYRLSPDSPCIDAGQNDDWMWDAVDLKGNSRIYPGVSSWSVDMGAQEYIPDNFRFLDFLRTTSDGIQVIWTSQPDESYAVWSCLDLSIGAWTLEASIPSVAQTTSWTDTAPMGRMKFYRVQME